MVASLLIAVIVIHNEIMHCHKTSFYVFDRLPVSEIPEVKCLHIVILLSFLFHFSKIKPKNVNFVLGQSGKNKYT